MNYETEKIRKNNFADWKPTQKKDSNLSFNSGPYYKQATVVFLKKATRLIAVIASAEVYLQGKIHFLHNLSLLSTYRPRQHS